MFVKSVSTAPERKRGTHNFYTYHISKRVILAILKGEKCRDSECALPIFLYELIALLLKSHYNAVV